ncbi:MAG: DinB family protein [Enhydrobacter sp.]|nr:DinB family protein [Enhydrobacter sp.]
MDANERNQLIEAYRTAFDEFEEALAGIPREAWQFRPAPGEWSVHEVIIHLADSETNSYLRARRLAVDPQLPLMAYDQDAWAAKLDYHSQDTDTALALTRLARLATYDFIKDLPDQVWAHVGVHPEYKDPYTFERWLSIYANHPRQHTEQILNNYTAWRAAQE